MNEWIFPGLILLVVVPINHSIIQGSGRGHRSNSGQNSVSEEQLSTPRVHRYLQQDLYGVQRIHNKLGGVYNLADHPYLLTVRSAGNSSSSDEHSEDSDNCTNPRNPPQKYKNSCDFVHDECASKAELIDYMAFVVCNLPSVQPIGFIIMAVWAIYLISLLATTVDIFFVPPLTFLADKLKLSPSIAGITLLALGNGAPDIFVAFSGILQDDLALVLGALTGGGVFITTIVLGTVILVSQVWPLKVDGFDFMRDVIAFMCVVVAIIAVAFDGKVYLVEACLFPLFYIVYIAIVICMSYARTWWKKKHSSVDNDDDSSHLVNEMNKSKENIPPPVVAATFTHSILIENIVKEPVLAGEHDDEKQLLTKTEKDEQYGSSYLPGLSWPKRAHWILKIIWFVQWPFSLLRWLTVPSFGYDGHWSKMHYFFTAFSPLPISQLMLLATKGLKGFRIYVGLMPLPAMLVILALVPSVLFFILLSWKKPPHWSVQILLVPMAFIMAIVWLNLEANEIVSVLRAFGLLLNVNTAILGLTVLALGNCAADWVADTVVARAGKPEMAIASCFGSPMLSHVLGISLAMIVKISIFYHGQPYQFHIHSPSYSEVKLSWIFLGLSLLVNIIFFPIFRFSPPKFYGFILMTIYTVFVVTAILAEVGVLPVNF